MRGHQVAPGFVVGTAAAAMVVSKLPVYLVAAAAVQLHRSLDLTATALGVAVSLYNLGAAAASVGLGRLTSRAGAARVLRGATAATALALVAGAVRTRAALVVVLLISGAVGSAVNPAANRLLAARIPPGRLRLAFGIKQAAVPGAVCLSGLALPAVSLTLGWRWTFAIAAGFAAAVAIVLPRARDPLSSRLARRPPPPAHPRSPLRLLALGSGLGSLAVSGLTTFTVLAAVAAGVANAAAGLLVGAAAAAAAAVRVVTGYTTQRRGSNPFVVTAVMLGVGTLGYVVLSVASARPSGWFFLIGAVIAFGAGWGWGGLFNFAIVAAYPRSPARASSVTSAANRLAGAVGPFLIGLLVERTSYGWAWISLAAVLLAAVGATLAGDRMMRSSRRE